MNHVSEIDTLLNDLHNDFFRNGLYNWFLYSASRNYARAQIDLLSAGDRTMSEARESYLNAREAESYDQIRWAFLRTPEAQRPTAEKIVDRLITLESGELRPADLQKQVELMVQMDEDDELPMSEDEAKAVILASRQEAGRRMLKQRDEAILRLESAYRAAARNPADLNEDFNPTVQQSVSILSAIASKGRDQRNQNKLRALRATGEFANTLLANNRLIAVAVKRAEEILHIVEQERDNAGSESFNGMH